jgi:hypothetical protein
MGKKSTKAVVTARVEEIYKLRLSGASLPDVREYSQRQDPPWGLSDGQLYRLIGRADALMRQRFDAKAPHLLAKHLLRREQIFAHAMAAGDFGVALRAVQDEAELEGLYPPRKTAFTDPTGEQPYAPALSPQERIAALTALYAVAGAQVAVALPGRCGTARQPAGLGCGAGDEAAAQRAADARRIVDALPVGPAGPGERDLGEGAGAEGEGEGHQP